MTLHHKGLPVAHVVQRCLWIEGEAAPDAVRDEGVQAGALVNFVEMRQGTALEQNPACSGVLYGRPVDIIEQSLGQIRGRAEILQSLLVLDTNCVAAKFDGDADGSDVHLALVEDLVVGEVCLGVRPGDKPHTLPVEPGTDLACLILADLAHGGVEGGLAEAFLKYASLME